jgi:subtilisin family serine protease
MSEREYIVGLNKGIDFESFNNEMISQTGNGFIPNRTVEIANYRPGSERLTHYYLTDEEAAILRNDPRITCVEIPPQHREDLKIINNLTQTGNFNKTSETSGSYVNWGLRRVIAETNVYSTGSTVSGSYTYTLDGSGVDIVIQDSGIQANHPEFNDSNNVSRVQQIDWYTATGISGSMPADHYTDYDGHGTHVAGIAAGKTYGWAKNSRIYAVKVDGLDAGEGGIPVTDCFDIIKVWHQNKPVDSTTGVKRPTIVNMSWGYLSSFVNIDGGRWRTSNWTGNTRQAAYGMIGVNIGGIYFYGTRVSSVDIDLQELIDAGVHICVAAGNHYQKVDVSGGLDYNNYFNHTTFGPRYYHRGSSPYDSEAIIVGNIDSLVTTIEQKAQSSNTGPGVDIFAPGTNIFSSTSNTNFYSGTTYPSNSSFKVTNLSGTSMASPQVAGVLALGLQLNPAFTPAEAKSWITNKSKTNLVYTTGSGTDYSDSRSILNGPNRYLFNPFSDPYGFTITSNP